MTHSGGKPHAVGDRGQRFEVTFFDPAANVRKVLGWTETAEDAQRMVNAVEAHPSWMFPQVWDRADAPNGDPNVNRGAAPNPPPRAV